MNKTAYYLMEIDLRQAESRFVAWDGPVRPLQQMYLDNIDVHKFVAAEIFQKPISEINHQERQLGKKSGHAANYDVGPNTFADSCLKEMNLVIPAHQANRILEGYHRVMNQEVRSWHQKLQDEIRRTKCLKTPFGWERYFYDRIGPNLFREAYAFRPQSTVPYVINQLMLWLFGQPGVTLLNQVHDALWLRVTEEVIKKTLTRICDQDSWNPKFQLAGGELRIPIEVKLGKNLKALETVFEG